MAHCLKLSADQGTCCQIHVLMSVFDGLNYDPCLGLASLPVTVYVSQQCQSENGECLIQGRHFFDAQKSSYSYHKSRPHREWGDLHIH